MQPFPDKPIRLAILSVPAHLPVVRATLDRLCELLGCSEAERAKVVLAVDEALTNVIRHAYHGAADKPIEVTFCPVRQEDQECLRIELRDWGQAADPDTIKSRDLTDVRPGGLGVHIMHTCMDQVRYEPQEGGGTRLTMVKRLQTGAGK